MENCICTNLGIVTKETVSQRILRTVPKRSGEASLDVILEKGVCAIKHIPW